MSTQRPRRSLPCSCLATEVTARSKQCSHGVAGLRLLQVALAQERATLRAAHTGTFRVSRADLSSQQCLAYSLIATATWQCGDRTRRIPPATGFPSQVPHRARAQRPADLHAGHLHAALHLRDSAWAARSAGGITVCSIPSLIDSAAVHMYDTSTTLGRDHEGRVGALHSPVCIYERATQMRAALCVSAADFMGQ